MARSMTQEVVSRAQRERLLNLVRPSLVWSAWIVWTMRNPRLLLRKYVAYQKRLAERT